MILRLDDITLGLIGEIIFITATSPLYSELVKYELYYYRLEFNGREDECLHTCFF